MAVPTVSVLIPVHNRQRYIADAVGSVLNQTLRDIEVIVADDGSTDATRAVVEAIGDPRLRVVAHDRNRGIPAARNLALSAATGRYVAWLDSDDVARPVRLAEQVAFLEAHPDVAMVGACAGKLRPDGTPRKGTRVPPLTPDLIAAWLLFRSAFQQSSVTGRRVVLQAHAYDPAFPVCEDVDMFLRLSAGGHRLANLPRVLIDRRIHPGQTVRQAQAAIRTCKSALHRPLLTDLGLAPAEDDLALHALLGKSNLGDVALPPDFLERAAAWLLRIRAANMRAGRYDPASLAFTTGYVWLLACRAAAPQLGRGRAMQAMTGTSLPLSVVSRHALRWSANAVPALLRH